MKKNVKKETALWLGAFFLMILAMLCSYGLMRLNTEQPLTKEKKEEKASEQEIQEDQSTIPASSSIVGEPLSSAKGRVTKKPFGIYITPESSPVQPERFTGYHTGTDFEVTAQEQDAVVPVFSICDGKVIYSGTVDGYGGVIIQACQIQGTTYTVLYGHLKRTSTSPGVGNQITRGAQFAELGQAKSVETAGERKHLHLGIYRGTSIDYRGYIQSANDLKSWVDFEKF